MQMVSNGDNLYDISDSVSWRKKKLEKYHQFVVSELAKRVVRVKTVDKIQFLQTFNFRCSM